MRRSAYWLALTALCLAPALALAAEGDYVLKAGKVCRVDEGGAVPPASWAPYEGPLNGRQKKPADRVGFCHRFLRPMLSIIPDA